MKKVIVTRIVAAVLVALGLVLGLLPPSPRIAYADTLRSFTFTNLDKERTALDLHIEFNGPAVKEVKDPPKNPVPFRDANDNLQVDGVGTNRLDFWGNPGVPPGGSITISFVFDGNDPKMNKAYFTYNGKRPGGGKAPGEWGSDVDIQEAESLISQAVGATKNEKLRMVLQALGPKPLSNIDTLMDKYVPEQIYMLAKLARDTRDPAADLLAKATAFIEKVMVKAGVSDGAAVSPPPAKRPDTARPQPALPPAPVPSQGGPVAQPAPGGALAAAYVLVADPRSGKPFLMPIEDVFAITGRGTVVTGRVERGAINPLISTISARDTREGRKVVNGLREATIWKGDVQTYRIWNDPSSVQNVQVLVGGKVEYTLAAGESCDVKGDDIKVRGTDAESSATVSYDRLGQ